MQVNKNKVITLPRAIQKGGYEFVCPCPVCTSKAQQNELKYINLQEVKSTIENILDSTSLYGKDFQIDISFSEEGNLQMLKDAGKKSLFPELVKIINYSAQIKQFTQQFNKQYRHPLVCELIDSNELLAVNIGGYIEEYQDKNISNERLWEFQKIITLQDSIIEILIEIGAEDIVESAKVESFIKKVRLARKEAGGHLREMFIAGLNSEDVIPQIGQQDFSPEYGY